MASEPVTLTLKAGTSTISMTNTVENGPNLDSVTITRRTPRRMLMASRSP